VLQEHAPSVIKKDSLVADNSAISELMNSAFAQHEITDMYKAEVS
jgi:hypothetical protein